MREKYNFIYVSNTQEYHDTTDRMSKVSGLTFFIANGVNKLCITFSYINFYSVSKIVSLARTIVCFK